MKKRFITLQLALALTCAHAQKVYTLQDWNIKDYEPGKELRLNVSKYKIDDKNPLFYQDMQKEWRLKAEVKCGTLGTEQVFVCKEGKGSFLIGKNSLTGDISLGFDNTAQRFFVEVIDKNEQGHRLWAARTGGERQTLLLPQLPMTASCRQTATKPFRYS